MVIRAKIREYMDRLHAFAIELLIRGQAHSGGKIGGDRDSGTEEGAATPSPVFGLFSNSAKW